MSAKSQDVLRRVALHVEEPRPGAFEWVLTEADSLGGGQWKVLKRARKASATYKVSMADGLIALQSLIEDLDTGPRAPAALEPEPPRRQADKRAARSVAGARTAEAPAKPPGRTAFGFGVLE
ncbi:hypothetical protein [Variovorax sp. Root434]|uniref:hypothetical protein n=1 Tax=Variovorax sp. Root434 TaxID=1736536 RepID=UPI0012F92EEE|nr:hypothetical protein [Variovorax sp. Root434]